MTSLTQKIGGAAQASVVILPTLRSSGVGEQV